MKFKFIPLALILGFAMSSWSASPRGRVSKQSVLDKVANKKSVSLYMPWAGISGGVVDTMGLHAHQRIALHGAIHQGTDFFHLKWDTTGLGPYEGLATKFVDSTINKGLALRDSLLALNPNLVIIGEMRVYDAIQTFLPDNSPFWFKKPDGSRVTQFVQKTPLGDINYYNLAVEKPVWQQQVATQCKALLETGIFDACLMDWATDDRYDIIKAVRDAVGPDAMLIGNVNHNANIDRIMPLLNGGYMEAGWFGDLNNPTTGPGAYMNRVQTTLSKANLLMLPPQIIGTEIWSFPGWNTGLTDDFKAIPENQKYLIRAGVTVHYIYANGYVSYFPHGFAGAPFYAEHMHVYDQFFNASLGTPVGAFTKQTNNSLQREWTKATVVYNPVGNASVTVTFSDNRRSQKDGTIGKSFTIPAFDGDIFLKGNITGEYTQMYPVAGSALKYEYPLPDTTYKGNISTGIFRNGMKPSASKFQMLNNQKNIIYKFQVEGEQPRFYNSEGREVELPKGFKAK